MNSQTIKKILIVAGEASGDLYGAKLVRDLRSRHESLEFYGMGGEMMMEAKVNLLVHAKELAIMGVVDVVKNFPKIFRAFHKIKTAILHDKPALVILIDYPGFNLRIARVAKKAGVKVLYYISPQIWAWRKGRIKEIKRYVDHMAVILPFEVDVYREAKMPVTFVGHPLLKIVQTSASKDEVRKRFGLDPQSSVIGLMPGSRMAEIRYLLPIMIQAAEEIKKENQRTEFILILAASLDEKDLHDHVNKAKIPIKVIKRTNYDALIACDAIIATSGTVTLEITLLHIPMVIVYKMSALNYFLAKKLVKVPYIGLCNLIANKKIVLELIQDRANSANIAKEINKILNDNFYRSKIVAELSHIKQMLTTKTTEDISALIIKML